MTVQLICNEQEPLTRDYTIRLNHTILIDFVASWSDPTVFLRAFDLLSGGAYDRGNDIPGR